MRIEDMSCVTENQLVKFLYNIQRYVLNQYYVVICRVQF